MQGLVKYIYLHKTSISSCLLPNNNRINPVLTIYIDIFLANNKTKDFLQIIPGQVHWVWKKSNQDYY